MSRQGVLGSVQNAARLLKALAGSREPRSLTELSRDLGLGKSTVHRLATTLVREGLVQQDPDTRRYYPGQALMAIGAAATGHAAESAAANATLAALSRRLHETVYVAVQDGLDVICIAHVAARQAVQVDLALIGRCPAYCSPAGKLLLAELDPADLARLLPPTLRPFTRNTITNRDVLSEYLARVKQQGYALDNEERDLGIRGVAAPVRNVDGKAVAAVGVVGPVQRLAPATVRGIIPVLMKAARQLSAQWGQPGRFGSA